MGSRSRSALLVVLVISPVPSDDEHGKKGDGKRSTEGNRHPKREAEPSRSLGTRRQVPGDGCSEENDVNDPNPRVKPRLIHCGQIVYCRFALSDNKHLAGSRLPLSSPQRCPDSYASTLLLVFSAFSVFDFIVLKQTAYLRRHTVTNHHSVTLTPLRDL